MMNMTNSDPDTKPDYAIVTVRNSSSRLPNKAIMKIKDSLRSIDIVIERAKKTDLPVVIATSTDSSDDIFAGIAKQHKVQIFRGSLINKIKRWYDCFNRFQIENALIVDGDDLAHNYEIGIRALSELKKSDFDIITCPTNIVTGFFTYAMKNTAISKLFRVASDEDTNTDVIARYVEKARLKVTFVTLRDYEQNKDIRLTLDYQEDLEFFRKLYSTLDILETGKNIIEFLEKNRDVSKINFFRQRDFLQNQARFNANVK
jgi:spore coat polysaccharide biosynthesis protein SpsF